MIYPMPTVPTKRALSQRHYYEYAISSGYSLEDISVCYRVSVADIRSVVDKGLLGGLD